LNGGYKSNGTSDWWNHGELLKNKILKTICNKPGVGKRNQLSSERKKAFANYATFLGSLFEMAFLFCSVTKDVSSP
jgi:hypothetical protein